MIPLISSGIRPAIRSYPAAHALSRVSRVTFSGDPPKVTDVEAEPSRWAQFMQAVHRVYARVKQEVHRGAKWTLYTVGLKGWCQQLHMKGFPKDIDNQLANMKAHASINNEAGGFQLLPVNPDGTYPEGRLFIDDMPVHADKVRQKEHFQLHGLHLWVSSKAIDPEGKTITPKRKYTFDWPSGSRDWFLDEIFKGVTPQQAKLVWFQHDRNMWLDKDRRENIRTYPHELDVTFDLSCRKTAQDPTLFTPDPHWFIDHTIDPDYVIMNRHMPTLREIGAEVRAGAKDMWILKQRGYQPVHSAFEAFGVPRLRQVIDKLVDAGELPADLEARQKGIPYPLPDMLPKKTSS